MVKFDDLTIILLEYLLNKNCPLNFKVCHYPFKKYNGAFSGQFLSQKKSIN